MTSEVRALSLRDRAWAAAFLKARAGSTLVVSRGRLHQADRLPGFIVREGVRAGGLLTYHVDADGFEVVTLHADPPGRGLGSRLLDAARRKAHRLGCRRLWLITTNDNLPAIRFYQRRGLSLAAVHRHAIRESRKLKPGIPFTGVDGRPIEDEVEFELRW